MFDNILNPFFSEKMSHFKQLFFFDTNWEACEIFHSHSLYSFFISVIFIMIEMIIEITDNGMMNQINH